MSSTMSHNDIQILSELSLSDEPESRRWVVLIDGKFKSC